MLTALATPAFLACDSGQPAGLGLAADGAFAGLVVALVLAALRLWAGAGARSRAGLALIAALALAGLTPVCARLAGQTAALWSLGLPVALFGMAALVLVLHRYLGFGRRASGLATLAMVAAIAAARWFGGPAGAGARLAVILPLLLLYGLAATLILGARLGMHRDRALTGFAAARSDRQYFPQVKMGYALIQSGLMLAVALVLRAYDQGGCSAFAVLAPFAWRGLVALALGTLALTLLRHEARTTGQSAPRGPRPSAALSAAKS